MADLQNVGIINKFLLEQIIHLSNDLETQIETIPGWGIYLDGITVDIPNGVKYQDIFVLLLNKVQDMDKQIKSLQEEVRILKA